MRVTSELRRIVARLSLPQRGRWQGEDLTDEEVTTLQIARLLKSFSEELDSSKK